MAAKRNRKAKIQIATRKGKINPSVRTGWLDAQGIVALVIIVIILAARMIAVLVKISWCLARLLGRLSWPVINRAACWTWRHMIGTTLAMRAFYPL